MMFSDFAGVKDLSSDHAPGKHCRRAGRGGFIRMTRTRVTKKSIAHRSAAQDPDRSGRRADHPSPPYPVDARIRGVCRARAVGNLDSPPISDIAHSNRFIVGAAPFLRPRRFWGSTSINPSEKAGWMPGGHELRLRRRRAFWRIHQFGKAYRFRQ